MEEVNDTIKRLENHGSPRTFSTNQVKGTRLFGLLMWFWGFARNLAQTNPTTPSPEIGQQTYTQICTRTCISLHLCAHPHARILAVVLCKTAKCMAILNNLSAEIGGLCSPIYEVFQDNYLWWVTYQTFFQTKLTLLEGFILQTYYICMWHLSLILYASNEKRSQLQLPPIFPTTVGFNQTR